jgi:hypothetical protein
MKDIIKICLGVLITVKVVTMLTSSNGSLSDIITDTIGVKKMTDGDTIQIQGMGSFSNSTLLSVKKMVEETYHVPTKIVQPIVLSSEHYVDGMVDSDKCINEFDDDQNKILITNETCYSIDHDSKIGGQGEYYGNIVILAKNTTGSMKRVLIHEIGHNEGLNHCDNKNCIMYGERDNDSNITDFCDECKKSL